MGSTWGNRLRISVYGESHGPAIGVLIDGLPAGIAIDEDRIIKEMKRRAPGSQAGSTSRKEPDLPTVLSGLFNGKTTGTPLAVEILNTNQHSSDYDGFTVTPRPGHADYAARLRYKMNNDPRGSGHFSGRLTAPVLFAGAIAKQVLRACCGAEVYGHIIQIGRVTGTSWDEVETPVIPKEGAFAYENTSVAARMEAEIEAARADQDSVGGVVEVMGNGFPGGIGSPMWDTVESAFAQLMFGVPAVKGVSFGSGFAVASRRGSQNNDHLAFQDGKLRMTTNHGGGFEGGISNGMPILAQVAFKPTPSIGKEQDTVNLETKENVKIEIQGRHDACIVPRALPVAEACLALAMLDAYLGKGGNHA
ncbi:MAG: chorismate synthase [Clostridiales bacterium]|nr:chorismate synthase [Candidatus Scatonaster coprocaballi]